MYVSRCFVEGRSPFFEKLLENKPENIMYFWLKATKLDNIPSIRYKMIWSHHAPNVKQHKIIASFCG